MEQCGDSEVSSVCCIAIKNVIGSLRTDQDFASIQVAIEQSTPLLIDLVSTHSDQNVRLESCDALVELITRFGPHLTAYHTKLVECMLMTLSSSHTNHQSTLIKRALQAIEALARHLPLNLIDASLLYLLQCLQNCLLLESDYKDSRLAGTDQHDLLTSPALRRTAASITEKLADSDSNQLIARHLLQAVNAVCLGCTQQHQSKQSSHLDESLVKSIIYLLCSSLHQHQRLDASEEMDFDLINGGCETQAWLLQLCETLVSRCSRQVQPMLPEIISILLERLTYDPNYNYDAEKDSMHVDCADAYDDTSDDSDLDDDDDEQDEDDSWKVRRASARALQAIVMAYPELAHQFIQTIGPVLIKQFIEHQEFVRLAVFSTTSALIKQVTISTSSSTPLPRASNPTTASCSPTSNTGLFFFFGQDSGGMSLDVLLADPESTQSCLRALLPSLFQAIMDQARRSLPNKTVIPLGHKGGDASNLFTNGLSDTTTTRTSANNVHQTAFMLNVDLAQALPGQLGDHIEELLKFIDQSLCQSNTGSNFKADMVNFLVLLVKTHPPNLFKPIMELLIKINVQAFADRFHRVVVEGFALTQLLLANSKPLGLSQHASVLFDSLDALLLQQSQLQSTGREPELKDKAMITSALFIQTFDNQLDTDQVKNCVKAIYQGLQQDVHRLAALTAIQMIAASKLSVDCIAPIPFDDLPSYLGKSDRQLRLTSLRCLLAVLSHRRPVEIGLSDACLTKIFETLPAKQMISDQDLQASQLAFQLTTLMLGGSKQQLVESIVKTEPFIHSIIRLTQSPLLRGQALDSLVRLLKLLAEKSDSTCQLYLTQLIGSLPCSSSSNRDSLPAVARCLAALLGSLQSSGKSLTVDEGDKKKEFKSIDDVVDWLINLIKTRSDSPMLSYLYILTLGEIGRQVDLSNRQDLFNLLHDLISSTTHASPQKQVRTGDDLKPAASLALGHLVLGRLDLAVLTSQLLDRIASVKRDHSPTQQSVYLFHLLQALREVFINATQPQMQVTLKSQFDNLWSLLLLCSTAVEEGSRNAVAECLARLCLLSPSDLILKLTQQLSDSSDPTVDDNTVVDPAQAYSRSTLLTAFKYLLIVDELDQQSSWTSGRRNSLSSSADPTSEPLTPVDKQLAQQERKKQQLELESLLQPNLLKALGLVSDPQLVVRRSALILFNTAAHHRPGLLRPILGQVSPLLYAETRVRPELVRQITIGPFKHKEDDGVETRKCAFECMSTLLDSCRGEQLGFDDFLASLIAGFSDHADIKLLCFPMIQRLCRYKPMDVLGKLDDLVKPIKTVLDSKPKGDWVKLELEKKDELNRAALRVIAVMESVIEGVDKQRCFVELLNFIKSDSTLVQQYKQIRTPIRSTRLANQLFDSHNQLILAASSSCSAQGSSCSTTSTSFLLDQDRLVAVGYLTDSGRPKRLYDAPLGADYTKPFGIDQSKVGFNSSLGSRQDTSCVVQTEASCPTRASIPSRINQSEKIQVSLAEIEGQLTDLRCHISRCSNQLQLINRYRPVSPKQPMISHNYSDIELPHCNSPPTPLLSTSSTTGGGFEHNRSGDSAIGASDSVVTSRPRSNNQDELVEGHLISSSTKTRTTNCDGNTNNNSLGDDLLAPKNYDELARSTFDDDSSEWKRASDKMQSALDSLMISLYGTSREKLATRIKEPSYKTLVPHCFPLVATDMTTTTVATSTRSNPHENDTATIIGNGKVGSSRFTMTNNNAVPFASFSFSSYRPPPNHTSVAVPVDHNAAFNQEIDQVLELLRGRCQRNQYPSGNLDNPRVDNTNPDRWPTTNSSNARLVPTSEEGRLIDKLFFLH